MLLLQSNQLFCFIFIILLINNVVSFPKVSINSKIINISSSDDNVKIISESESESLGPSPDALKLHSKVMQSYMNKKVDPCDDFYTYACGNWENIHPIPKDYAEYSVLLSINKNILEALKDILSTPMKNSNNNKFYELNAEEKSKLFYLSCTDMKTINHRNNEPLLKFIDRLGGWPVLDDNWNDNKFDLIDLCAKVTKLGIRSFLNIHVDIDFKNTENYALYIEGGELSLDIPIYYIIDENPSNLMHYKNLIITILTLLDIDHDKAEETANEIINFETNLLHNTIDLRDNLGIQDQYFGTTLGELSKKDSKFNLTRYLNLVLNKEFQSDQRIISYSSPLFGEMIEFISNTDKRTLSNYIIWRCVKSTYRELDERFLAAAQIFDEGFSGQTEPKSQWEKCVEFINEKMGMTVGAQFVRRYFDENSKKDVEKLTQEIRNIFKKTLNDLDWIDDETKRKTKEKANIIQLAVGYPDFILSINELNKFYNNVRIENGKHFENALNLVMFEHMKSFENLGKKVDKSEWPTYPAIVNAMFEPNKNRIIIPAGLLQPPLYHHILPKALIYGGIGVFIGHEFTHGFDEYGLQFNSDGNMITWWSNSSIQHVIQKTNCFIEQYSNFSLHGKFLSGESSKSENVADNGGIIQAFKAYKKWLKNADEIELANEKLPNLNLTNKQLFFLGFAQSWCGQVRRKAMVTVIDYLSHCPKRFRVIGTLSNFKEFSKAYNCPIGTPMNPAKKCQLW